MGVLSGLKPEKVFSYFEEISKIPHGSFNMEQISRYVCDEGIRLGHKAFRDEANNVVILAKASKGYEDKPTVMLQGHLDMVAEKTADSDFDFSKDALKLFIDGDFIGAKGTTLGGDDGFAVAMMLAILSDPELPHPALECVFTTDEEVGLVGASKLDLSFSKAKYLINLDSELEGEFLVSCAGGARFDAEFPVEKKNAKGFVYQLKVESSLGGHSGSEITKGRPNTNIVLGQILYDLKKSQNGLSIVSMNGGRFDNAIPVLSEAVIVTPEKIDISPVAISYANEYATTDSVLTVSLNLLKENGEEEAFSDGLTERILAYFEFVPNGVIAMNHVFKSIAETSLNLGILKTEADQVVISHSVRSSMESKKVRLLHTLTDLSESVGAKTDIHGRYPGWDYKIESPLRDLMVRIWDEKYAAESRKANIIATHGGVECGLILGQLPELDIVSIGPDMKDIHTTSERLKISSVARIYAFLADTLKMI